MGELLAGDLLDFGHVAQNATKLRDEGLPPFKLGIGLSTGEVAAAILGSDERMEYTVVGDIVNLSQRLQDWARPGGQTVISEATVKALSHPIDAAPMEPQTVKGREAPVIAYKLG